MPATRPVRKHRLASMGAAITATTVAALIGIPGTALAASHRASATTFSDVSPSSQFGPAIYDLANAGVINGYPDGTFRPANTVTRQAFVAFLARVGGTFDGQTADGTCPASSPSSFPDVPDSSSFCYAINGLASINVVGGYDDGTFRPTALVSRQAIAAYIERTASYFASKGDATKVSDAAPTNTTFSDVTAANNFSGDIAFLVTNHIAGGYPDGTYQPLANATRQATAALLDKFSKYLDMAAPAS